MGAMNPTVPKCFAAKADITKRAPSLAPFVRKTFLTSGRWPSRFLMKSHTSSLMNWKPTESVYAPTFALCCMYSLARATASPDIRPCWVNVSALDSSCGAVSSARTSLLNVRGSCPTCCGLPMLQYTNSLKGYFEPLVNSCCITAALVGSLPRTAYSAARTCLLIVSRVRLLNRENIWGAPRPRCSCPNRAFWEAHMISEPKCSGSKNFTELREPHCNFGGPLNYFRYFSFSWLSQSLSEWFFFTRHAWLGYVTLQDQEVRVSICVAAIAIAHVSRQVYGVDWKQDQTEPPFKTLTVIARIAVSFSHLFHKAWRAWNHSP